MLFIIILKIIIIIAILGYSADKFVSSSLAISQYLKWSPIITGTVLIGFATTIPEIMVSIIAIKNSHINLALGNAFGSYITNIGLVVGICAIIKPIVLETSLLKKELPLLLASLFITILLILDQSLGMLDSILLLIALSITLFLLFNKATITKSARISAYKTPYAILIFATSFTMIILSSNYLVDNAIIIAKLLNASELTIGLTIVAVGTSIPELATSIACILKKQNSMAIGNIIGSNILVLLMIVALPGIFNPSKISAVLIWRDATMMIVITLTFWLFIYNGKNKAVISRTEGFVLLSMFISYMLLVAKFSSF